MTEQQIRSVVADALEYAGVLTMRRKGVTPVFLAGSEDIRFDDLEMDSLAAMELCIAIETNTGVSVMPDELRRIGSLNGLVRTIRERMR